MYCVVIEFGYADTIILFKDSVIIHFDFRE